MIAGFLLIAIAAAAWLVLGGPGGALVAVIVAVYLAGVAVWFSGWVQSDNHRRYPWVMPIAMISLVFLVPRLLIALV